MFESKRSIPEVDQASLEALPVVGWETDSKGMVTIAPVGGAVTANSTAWSGWHGRRITDPKSAGHALAGMIEAALGGVRRQEHIRLGSCTYSMTVGPKLDESGAVNGTIGFAIDVTETWNLQQDLDVRD
ncbi:MAG: hypothetical protein GY895_06305, partial [Phycisphaera sp.]|nr:hypothetical protein [Phycisphaera sp.]